jgi:hypothetical protein
VCSSDLSRLFLSIRADYRAESPQASGCDSDQMLSASKSWIEINKGDFSFHKEIA